MKRVRLAIFSVALGLAGWVHAQAPAATPVAAPAAAAPSTGAIQGQNIFEVKPDANLDPKYAGQTNAERAKVQIFQHRACRVATQCACDQLDDKVHVHDPHSFPT